MAGSAFPLAGGVKHRGVNLVPPLSYWSPERALGWSSMWVAWAEGDTTIWTQWLKPQIDAAYSLGANCVRIMMDPPILYGSGTITTQAKFEATLGQLGAYLASLGMWWYVTPCTSACVDYAHTNLSVSQANIEAYIGIVAAYTTALTNVLGCDVVQEIDFVYIPGVTFAVDHMADWLAAWKAARVRAVPVTCSFAIGTSQADLVASYKYPAILAAGAEFRDCHIYFQGTDNGIDTLLTDSNPTWIGEMGIQYPSGDFVGATPSTPAALYATMAAWGGKDALQGILQWSVVTLPAIYGDWGCFENHQTGGYVFDQPRTSETVPFATIPKAPTYAAPSVSVNGTIIGLTWTNFQPGATYTPQYAPRDSNGFPTSTWQSGTGTSGTSGSVHGLLPHTNYAFRIQAA